MLFFYLFVFFFGTAIGSFLNVLIDRLPQEESIMGRSHCDYCKHKLGGFDLIPIISFLILKGRCRDCKEKLSYQYPLIEFLTGVVFVLTWINLPADNFLIKYAYLTLMSSLIVVFFSDLKYQIIPDSIQIAFLIATLFVGGAGITPYIFFLKVVAAFVIMAPILFLHVITRGRGMGFGDVKFAFIMGFLLGIKGGVLALYIAFILGAVVGVALLVLKKTGLKSKIAFGPFLVIGVVVTLFAKDILLSTVFRIYGF